MLIEWDDDEDKMTIDEAHITLGGTEEIPYYLTAGKLYVPFGLFETMMISDPITCDLAEIADEAIQVGAEINGIRGAAYVFNGQTDEAGKDDKINNFGVSIGYAMENDTLGLDVGADWTNSILESDTLNELVEDTGDLDDYAAGVAVHAMVNLGPFCVIGEYVEVLDDIDFTDGTSIKKMSAYAVELGYTFDVSGFETTIAVGFQASDEAAGILPEDKYLGTIGVAINDYFSVAAEYASADDYSESDGGEGNDVDTLTIQLAFVF